MPGGAKILTGYLDILMQSQKSFEPPLQDVTAVAMSAWTLLTA